MLQSSNKLIPVIKQMRNLLKPEVILNQQLRTTFILKRKYPAPLHKNGMPLKRLRGKHYIYELVKDTDIEKKPDLNLILTQYVDGLGNTGDKVTVPSNIGYNKLLLPGCAVYANPENIERYKHYESDKDEIKHSSPFAQLTADEMSKMFLSVVMNKDNPWTIQPWHIRTSFRKCLYVVPEETITLPEKPICGPDMNLENREFEITVTINNLEKVNVRCRIHHWTTDEAQRLPHVHEFWNDTPGPVFDETTPNSTNQNNT